MFLADISIRRPVLTTIVVVILSIMGVSSYLRLGVELLPDIELPFVAVSTTYLGAGPEEVERLISKPIEDTLGTIDDVEFIQSMSAEGVSTVMIRFALGTDIDTAANDVRDKVSLIERELPQDADKPVVMKFDPSAQPVLRLAVSGERPLTEIFEMADDRIRTVLGKVSGVASIQVVGGEQREIEVAVERSRLDAYGVSIGQVIAGIGSENLKMPGGHVTRGAVEYSVRVLGEIEDVATIRDIALTGTGGRVRVGDVAAVADTVAEVRKKARSKGRRSVGIWILKQGDANTIAVGQGIRAGVKKLNEKILPSDLHIEIITDESIFIRDVVREVRTNIWQGIALTALALFLFLHSWRGTLVAALAMPAAVVGTLIPLYFAGYTINMMSMMGLAISVGILVNNSILVLENIYRHIDLGYSPKEAASKGTADISVAVASTTLTNIVVFLPIAFMESIAGMIFRQFAMAVVFSTVLSLFISFTLTPMAASLLLRSKADEDRRLRDWQRRLYARWDGVYERMAGSYEVIIGGIVRRPWVTLGAAVLMFVVIMGIVPRYVGKEFFPRTDEGEFAVTIETDVASSLGHTDRVAQRVEAICTRTIPELEKLFTSVGELTGEGVGGMTAGVNLAEVVVRLVDKAERTRSTDQVMDALRVELARVPAAGFKLGARQMGGPGGGLELEIKGDDIEVLNRIAGDAIAILEGHAGGGEAVKGLVDLDTDWRVGKPEIALRPRRARMRRLGVTIQALSETIRAYYSGTVASRYREGDDEYDIRVILDEADRENLAGLCDLAVQAADGRLVKIGEFVDQIRILGPTLLSRKDREHMVKITAGVSARTSGRVAEEIDARLASYVLPDGYVFEWGGEIEFQKTEIKELKNAAIMAIVLTLLMLAGILESWRLSVLIMLSLPFSFAGVFTALLLRGSSINLFSMMGIVMLVGLVINNSIVIIDHAETVWKSGVPLIRAVPRACAVRLRPILMANLTTLIAMIPLALGIGAGGEFRAPMAVTQMGGMVGGGVLALFITPAIYTLAQRGRARKMEQGHPPASS